MTLSRIVHRGSALILAAGLVFAACAPRADSEAYNLARKNFQEPPAEFRSAPLWVWNDRMTRDKVAADLADFKDHGIGGVFIHPRPGLITPYLSEEWLDLCRFAVETGKSLGMKVWIYDENSYPSGFAGGHVPAQMPDAVRTGLRLVKGSVLPRAFAKTMDKGTPLVVLRRAGEGFEDVTAGAAALASSGEKGDYYVFFRTFQSPSPWFGGFSYVDIMRRDVTEKFLDVTLNAYQRSFGAEFGGVVPGVFQDEAEINPAGGADTINYTPALFQAFQGKWGYDLRPALPSLFEETGDWRKVRHDFYDTLLDLFIENWAKPYYAYCADNNLVFTGHYWEHEWPRPRVSPDSLAMAAYAHMPGIDILMNGFQRDSHAQFGNARAVREIRSAANQHGRRRTMSETYGAGGWDMTFEDQKRIGDWEYALGVNFLNQHLSYATIKGARKRDHPLSFTPHEPWWSHYPLLADYFGRLSVVMSFGEQLNPVLVLEPTTSAWMYYSPQTESEKLEALGSTFQEFVHRLENEQLEYDLAAEKTLEEFGRAEEKRLVVGQRAYELVVLPPGTENLDGPTVALLRDYLERGGRVVAWEEPPAFVDGEASDEVRALAARAGDRWVRAADDEMGFRAWRGLGPPSASFEGLGEADLVFHQVREFEGGRFVFLANTHPVRESAARLTIRGGSVEAWEALTGEVRSYAFERQGDRVSADFRLPVAGSLLLCVRDRRQRASAPTVPAAGQDVPPSGEIAVKRLQPNILTLDYCDLVMDGKTVRDLYFYDAQRRTFEGHGLTGNPWDSAVQYKTNILDLDTFSRRSGFEAVFSFAAAEGDYLASLQAVVERPELLQVSINGQEIEPRPDAWWLDKAFAVYDIGLQAKPGRNRLKVAAKPFSIHAELEPIYILGDFRLRAAAKGFSLEPAATLAKGSWSTQGLPFYGAAVAYEQAFEIPVSPEDRGRFVVKLDGWKGAVAEVLWNGRPAGRIAFPPYELELAEAPAPGRAVVTAVIYGTLKNTLGPHHGNPDLGRAWPGSFQRGAAGGPPPGSSYSVVGYGLSGDIRLTRRSARGKN
ncbi:MAG: glycosyl hydrolase [Candidatus Aminicenantes bacterium]|nr:glycosyl hydrolase [Candidatus Aminicenantes bacterium]